MSETLAAKTPDQPNILSLPDDIINIIGCCLNEQDVCSTEIANKGLHSILSTPSHVGPCKTPLNLKRAAFPRLAGSVRKYPGGPLTSGASRWIQKRVKRYTHINSDFDVATMSKQAINIGMWTAIMPPLLPSLLAACAPSAELSLNAGLIEGRPAVSSALKKSSCLRCRSDMANLMCTRYNLHMCPVHQMRASHSDRLDESAHCDHHNSACSSALDWSSADDFRCAGEKLLALLSSESIATGAGPELASFRLNLERHLTELTVHVGCKEPRPRHLEALSSLTAQQKLRIDFGWPIFTVSEPGTGLTLPGLRNMSKEKFVFRLPHLASLHVTGLRQVELTLSCPKLALAHFKDIRFSYIEVEDAALTSLVLKGCQRVHVATGTLNDQLRSLESLSVKARCVEVGRCLIEVVCQMERLQKLEYEDFPSGCMPNIFPQSLCHIALSPLGWSQDLPQGLKELRQLRVFNFCGPARSWRLTRPIAELLPMDQLTVIVFNTTMFIRQQGTGAHSWVLVVPPVWRFGPPYGH